MGPITLQIYSLKIKSSQCLRYRYSDLTESILQVLKQPQAPVMGNTWVNEENHPRLPMCDPLVIALNFGLCIHLRSNFVHVSGERHGFSETVQMILLPAHPASFAHKFVSGGFKVFISASPRMH